MIEECWATLNGNELAVAKGQDVRISRGSFHTIQGESLLKVMEVQVGENIDVDDKIVWSVENKCSRISMLQQSITEEV